MCLYLVLSMYPSPWHSYIKMRSTHRERQFDESVGWGTSRPTPATYQSLTAKTASSRIPPRGSTDGHPYCRLSYDTATFGNSGVSSRPGSSHRYYAPRTSAPPSSIDSQSLSSVPATSHHPSAAPSAAPSVTAADDNMSGDALPNVSGVSTNHLPSQGGPVTHASLKYIHTLLLQHQSILEQHTRDIEALQSQPDRSM